MKLAPLARACALLLAFVVSSCGKSDSPGERAADSLANEPKAAIDTTQPAKEAIVDSTHYIYFQPAKGTVRRYRLTLRSNVLMNVKDDLLGGPQGKQTSTNHAVFYIRETVGDRHPDSTVDLTFVIDSARVQSTQDTMRVSYSSNNAAQRNEQTYAHFTAIVGKEIKARITNHGDPKRIDGLEAIVAGLVKQAPDSLPKEQVKQIRTMQVQSVINQSIIRLLVYLPTRPVAKDTAWSDRIETNIPVTQQIMFPVVIQSNEVVRGFEDHNGTVVAVLEAMTTTKPVKTVQEHGQAKASLTNFSSAVKGVTRVEDKTGMIVHRTLSDKRNYVFTLESKQQPGKLYRLEQNTSEEMLVEALR